MTSFTRYEITGISITIIIVIVIFAGTKFFNNDTVATNTDKVLELPSDEEETDARTEVLLDAVGVTGEIEELVIQDVAEGDGKEVAKGDMVTVHYRGVFVDGTEFDSSYDKDPFRFRIGDGKVIEGWDKGILGMKEGGQRILIIPAHMAYGNSRIGTIPPNSTLVFSIELLEVI